MPITNAQIAALPVYTASELLIITESCIASILVGGQAYGQNGRTFTRADLPTLYAQRDQLKNEIAMADAGANGSGNVLVTLGGVN